MEGAKERTYLMIKPDGVQRGLIGRIIERFEEKGFKLVGLKLRKPTKETVQEHYAEHKGKPFFDKIVDAISSGVVICMVWEGKEVIKTARTMIGATNPLNAAPGTIRGDWALESGKNIIHGSDGPESAEREIKIWFKEDELVEWDSAMKEWIYEKL